MPANPLRQRELPCGCVLSRYQSGDGIAVWIVETLGETCRVPGHRLNAMLAPVEPRTARHEPPSDTVSPRSRGSRSGS